MRSHIRRHSAYIMNASIIDVAHRFAHARRNRHTEMSDRQDVKRKEAAIDYRIQMSRRFGVRRNVRCHAYRMHMIGAHISHTPTVIRFHASHPAFAPLSVVPGMGFMLLSRIVVLHVCRLGSVG